MISQNGYLWIHPVQQSQLSITMGDEKALHTYHFAMRGTTHLVCSDISGLPNFENGIFPIGSQRGDAQELC